MLKYRSTWGVCLGSRLVTSSCTVKMPGWLCLSIWRATTSFSEANTWIRRSWASWRTCFKARATVPMPEQSLATRMILAGRGAARVV
jgi:hypothetical protein